MAMEFNSLTTDKKMGVFYYSKIPNNVVTKDQLTILLQELLAGLLVEECGGIPVTPEDNRIAKWAFYLKDNNTMEDCSFSVSLLKDYRLEFKVPRSQWDGHFERQQKLRRELIVLLKTMGKP